MDNFFGESLCSDVFRRLLGLSVDVLSCVLGSADGFVGEVSGLAGRGLLARRTGELRLSTLEAGRAGLGLQTFGQSLGWGGCTRHSPFACDHHPGKEREMAKGRDGEAEEEGTGNVRQTFSSGVKDTPAVLSLTHRALMDLPPEPRAGPWTSVATGPQSFLEGMGGQKVVMVFVF